MSLTKVAVLRGREAGKNLIVFISNYSCSFSPMGPDRSMRRTRKVDFIIYLFVSSVPFDLYLLKV